MCLAIPAKVIEISDLTARVEVGGNIRDANISLVENLKVGDYVMLHAGFAISKLDEDQAEETLGLLKEGGFI